MSHQTLQNKKLPLYFKWKNKYLEKNKNATNYGVVDAKIVHNIQNPNGRQNNVQVAQTSYDPKNVQKMQLNYL